MLVHGAWHGGWCWRRVADALEAAGHKVFTPTLTGLADRAHLLTPALTLDTHIADVANLIRWENLEEVVLCGHSYAGFVIAGVVEQVAPTIAAVVFVDAYVPRDGQSMYDVATPTSRVGLDAARKAGDAVRPVPAAASFSVNPADRPWVDGKMTPQPVSVQLQPIRLTGAVDRVRRKGYVRAAGYANPTFEGYFDAAASRPGWETFRVDSGHDVMVDAPAKMAQILLTFV